MQVIQSESEPQQNYNKRKYNSNTTQKTHQRTNGYRNLPERPGHNDFPVPVGVQFELRLA
ncbi:Protein of unknown function [Pyronema omphalodes CBS 100304]|uniref:Uncharacterized protein n=1 Tax=Pyronema omphalodes (strain CBS 100304) TaxID=1076935 RepID=U4KZM6_PYROM|nr:Protein of unknown function [Pyronema omphalodes CBS 100304]